MSAFSPDWLALREPADHEARGARLLERLAARFESAGEITITDLGCGTGSNLRATAPALPANAVQRWRLIDNDPKLLDAARTALAAWATSAETEDGVLTLRKDGRSIHVSFTNADLADPDAALAGQSDIITAAAFFDLVSPEWLARFAGAARGASAIYAVLTYNGVEVWTPPHPADGPMLAAFHIHQRTSKGFGPAAGPDAGALLAEALSAAGFAVETEQSPWRLSATDRALIEQLAAGSASAVAELGLFDAQVIEDWRRARRQAQTCLIGHIDLLALKR